MASLIYCYLKFSFLILLDIQARLLQMRLCLLIFEAYISIFPGSVQMKHFVRIFRSIFFALVDKLRTKS